MKSNNKKTGNVGEDLAVEFLENKRYLIVERNFRTRFGEVDIVCLDAEKLVFVEVKTKIGHDFGEPEEMIGKSKIAQVRRMGEIFVTSIESFKKKDCLFVWGGVCRVDVVAVVLTTEMTVERISHYEAVY